MKEKMELPPFMVAMMDQAGPALIEDAKTAGCSWPPSAEARALLAHVLTSQAELMVEAWREGLTQDETLTVLGMHSASWVPILESCRDADQ